MQPSTSENVESREAVQSVTDSSKVVIRGLPPHLSEDHCREFLQSIIGDKVKWFRYHSGKVSVRGSRPSVAYVQLTAADAISVLKWTVERQPLIDERGNSYLCTVELAPYQKIPKPLKREDPRCGTYEQDPVYQDFMKQMEDDDSAAQRGPVVNPATAVEQPTVSQPIITSLMQHIADKHRKPSGAPKQKNGRARSTATAAVPTSNSSNTASAASRPEARARAPLEAIKESEGRGASQVAPARLASHQRAGSKEQQQTASSMKTPRTIRPDATSARKAPHASPAADKANTPTAVQRDAGQGTTGRARPKIAGSALLQRGVRDALNKAGLSVQQKRAERQ